MAALLLNPIETIERRVLVAVELFDPVAQTIVHRGMDVTASGLDSRPILSASGRFVWIAKPGSQDWPTRFDVDVASTPYLPASQPGPARPADIANASAAQRLTRIVLAPRPSYLFPEGVTVISGTMRETVDEGAAAVVGAEVALSWQPDSHPAQLGQPIKSPLVTTTDAVGEFALVLIPTTSPKPLLDTAGRIAIHIQVTRGGTTRSEPQTRLVPEARRTDLWPPLAWTDLT